MHHHPANGYASNNICPLVRYVPALLGISLHSVAASYILKRTCVSLLVSASHMVLPLGIVLCRYTQARRHLKDRLGFVCLFPHHFSPLFNTPFSPRFTSCCSETHYGIYWKAHNVFSHVLLATLTSPFLWFMPIWMSGWSYSSSPTDDVRFKESVKTMLRNQRAAAGLFCVTGEWRWRGGWVGWNLGFVLCSLG